MAGPDSSEPKPLPGSPLDFTHKHPVFNIELEKQGHEFGDIYEKR